MKPDATRFAAARSLAAGKSQAAAARDAGINRSTIKRWLQDASFQDLLREQRSLLDEPAPLDETAEKGLGSLVPQAIAVLEQALSGETTVTAAKARVALDIVKAAATLHSDEAADGAPSSLAAIIEKLDERSSRSD